MNFFPALGFKKTSRNISQNLFKNGRKGHGQGEDVFLHHGPCRDVEHSEDGAGLLPDRFPQGVSQNGPAPGTERGVDGVRSFEGIIHQGEKAGEDIRRGKENDDLRLLTRPELVDGLEDTIGRRRPSRDHLGEVFPGPLRCLDVAFPLHLAGDSTGEEIFDFRPWRFEEPHVIGSSGASEMVLVKIDNLPLLSCILKQPDHAPLDPFFRGHALGLVARVINAQG